MSITLDSLDSVPELLDNYKLRQKDIIVQIEIVSDAVIEICFMIEDV